MKLEKRDFITLLAILIGAFLIITYIAETGVRSKAESAEHSFGPQLSLASYSTNSLIIISIIGLLITMTCAVFLERNISRIASKTDKSIGTALMGIASSIPLLVIVITLALEKRGDLAITNVISANIANLTLVLGILALFKPLRRGKSFQRGIIAIGILLLSISTIFYSVNISLDVEKDTARSIDTYDGYALIGLFLLFIIILNMIKSHEGNHLKSKNIGKEITLIILYGIGVAWFANTTVKAFIIIAENHSIPAIIIGSVIGVIGASLPELAIGLVSLIKKEHEAIYSNLITSNIVNFNLGIGIAAIMLGSIIIDEINIAFKIPFMAFTMIATTIFFLPRKHEEKKELGLTRLEGIILILLFATWIYILLRIAG